jgi:ribosome-binding protein aMBF1 (putative translation factor)
MKNRIKEYTFREDLRNRLKDPEFKKAWEDFELEYQIATQLIEARLAKKLSQRDLAKKMKTSQAVISRIEGMDGNPSISLLRRFAQALNTTFNFSIS